MALVCLCRGNFYWPPHTTILFCSIFLDKIVLDTLKSRYHRSAPLGMQFVLQKTKMGLGTRDIMQDIQTSSLMGIPTNTIIPGIYALGGFLGVFGGVLYCSYYSYISIDMGMLGTIKAWAVVMLGGVGSFWGAFFGGIILGIAEAMAGAYVGTAFRDAMGYLIIVFVLMFRPEGLFGVKKAEKV